MKIFGLIIIKQGTMDNLCERLADDRKDACIEAASQAREIPTRMISDLLWQIHGKEKMITKEELLKKFDELECERHLDSHPQVHKLIADFIVENYNLSVKTKTIVREAG